MKRLFGECRPRSQRGKLAATNVCSIPVPEVLHTDGQLPSFSADNALRDGGPRPLSCHRQQRSSRSSHFCVAKRTSKLSVHPALVFGSYAGRQHCRAHTGSALAAPSLGAFPACRARSRLTRWADLHTVSILGDRHVGLPRNVRVGRHGRIGILKKVPRDLWVHPRFRNKSKVIERSTGLADEAAGIEHRHRPARRLRARVRRVPRRVAATLAARARLGPAAARPAHGTSASGRRSANRPGARSSRPASANFPRRACAARASTISRRKPRPPSR